MAVREPELLVPKTFVEQEILRTKSFSLQDFWTILQRRRLTALKTFLAVLAVGLILLVTSRPLYRASARMLVEGKTSETSSGNNSDSISTLFLNGTSHETETQIGVLQSADLIAKVARLIGIKPDTVQVEVRQLGKTDLADLTVTSSSRAAAEKFAATLPRIYLEQVKTKRTGSVTAGLNFTRRRLQQKTLQLNKAETALKNFKNRVGVVDPAAQRTQDIAATATAEANARQALSEATSALARLDTLRRTRQQTAAFISSPVTTTNPEVGLLRDRIAGLREERSRLLFLYKPNHDEVRKVDVGIAALERRLATTPAVTTSVTRAPNPAIADIDAKIGDARAQYQAAQATWNSATASAARLQNNLSRYNAIEMRDAQLQRAIVQARSAVEVLSRSVEEMSVRQQAAEAAQPPIEVVAAAGPAERISPRPLRTLIATLLLGTILACAAALLRESLDEQINNEEEARALLGLPVLGHLPARSGDAFLIGLTSNPQLIESYRMLRSNVHFALRGRCDHVVQVVSTLPGEGKTRVACNLAVAMAMENWRVVLVDANFRSPELHDIFHLKAAPGLTEVLAGQSTLKEALKPTNLANLQIMPAGMSSSAAELLNSAAMDGVLRDLSSGADFVIFDGPACLSSADAPVLASKADGVLLVMELGHVQRSAVRRSIEQLQQAHAHVLGIALSNARLSPGVDYAAYEETTQSAASAKRDADVIGTAPFDRLAAGQSAQRYVTGVARTSAAKKWVLGLGAVVVAALVVQALRARATGSSEAGRESTPTRNAAGMQMRVADMIGEAQIWRGASVAGTAAGKWQTLGSNEVLKTGATGIRTGQDSALLLQLGEAGVLRVGPNTKFKIRHVGGDKYSVLLKDGKVWAMVNQAPTAAALQVRTPLALLSSDRGLFSVASGSNGALTMTSTVKGDVRVRRGQQMEKVTKGYALRIERNAPSLPRPIPLKPTARAMWHDLHKGESWPQPEGALRLDYETVFKLQ